MTFNRESVFLSALRSFCNALGVVLGIFIAFILVMFSINMLSQPEILPEKSEMTIAPDATGSKKLLASTTPVILRINIQGVIGLDGLTSQNIQNILYDSREDHLGNNRVHAVFLYIDTPGGTATDGAGIYQALLDYKKTYNIPMYAFVDGMCASAGMYIASAADKIYATSASVVGSVGVLLGPCFNFTDLMTKVGVKSITLTQGKDKDELSPFRPWKEDEAASLVSVTKELYDQFVDAVVAGRPSLDKEKLVHEYGAHVFLAPTAQKLGYIDVAGSDYTQAMKDLSIAANLKETYQVIQMSRPESFFSQLAQNKFSLLSGKINHVVQMGPYMNSELSGKLLYLYQPN